MSRRRRRVHLGPILARMPPRVTTFLHHRRARLPHPKLPRHRLPQARQRRRVSQSPRAPTARKRSPPELHPGQKPILAGKANRRLLSRIALRFWYLLPVLEMGHFASPLRRAQSALLPQLLSALRRPCLCRVRRARKQRNRRDGYSSELLFSASIHSIQRKSAAMKWKLSNCLPRWEKAER